jgi:hypothetical protein
MSAAAIKKGSWDKSPAHKASGHLEVLRDFDVHRLRVLGLSIGFAFCSLIF